MPLHLQLNGQARDFVELNAGDSLETLIAALNLQGDRIAVEHNGEIAPRSTWPHIDIKGGDRLELVHFVGGGSVEGDYEITTNIAVQNICYRT